MIYVRDKGRMCNNILQYGHLYAWGREHGRETMSMRFAYKYPYFNISEERLKNFPRYLMAKAGAAMGLLPVVSFNTPGMDMAPNEREMLSHKNIVAEGWEVRFYDLFLKYKDEIIFQFGFNDKIVKESARWWDFTRKGLGSEKINSLGVHIRRGDYATWQGGKYYYDDEVYISIIEQAIKVLIKEDWKMTVTICGNDPKIDRELYKRRLETREGIRIFFHDGNPGEDLCVLSDCDYIIGAPSTFSLVASMYFDTPLYWILDPKAPVTPDKFKLFDELFRQII